MIRVDGKAPQSFRGGRYARLKQIFGKTARNFRSERQD